MSEPTKQQEERTNARQPAECAKPDYRSYVRVASGKLPPPQLKEGDKVRFSLSKTESPLWTVADDRYNNESKLKEYQLMKNDGSLYENWVTRDKLVLQD